MNGDSTCLARPAAALPCPFDDNPDDAAASALLGLIQLDRGEYLSQDDPTAASEAYRNAYNAFNTAIMRLDQGTDDPSVLAIVARSGQRPAHGHRARSRASQPAERHLELHAKDEPAERLGGPTSDTANNLLTAYLGLQGRAYDERERARHQAEIDRLLALVLQPTRSTWVPRQP